MNGKFAAALFALLFVGASPARAQNTAANCSLATFSIAFDSCWNAPVNTNGGNAWDANGATLATFLNANEPAGANWAGVQKVDAVGSGGGTGSAFSFSRTNATGVLTFTPALDAGWFALAFKQGSTNAVYTFDAAVDVSTLTFNLTNVFVNTNNGNPQNAISNISMWRGAIGGPPDPSVVPEPMTMSLVGFGFLGLVAVARRRRQS